MTRTIGHGTNGQPVTQPGAEWWGKRPMTFTVKGSKRWARWYKRRLHKAEHRAARQKLVHGDEIL